MKKKESNVNTTKERDGSFVDEGKEPFSARLKSLLAGRSVYQASKDWEVNLSTLKNYFSRQNSTPRHEVLARISKCEGVSVEWLLYGGSNETQITDSIKPHIQQTLETTGLSASALKLASILNVLDEADLDDLTTILMRKGAETILYLLDEDNIALLRLDKVVKEKILGKQPETKAVTEQNYEKAKECGTDNKEHTYAENLASNKKQAV